MDENVKKQIRKAFDYHSKNLDTEPAYTIMGGYLCALRDMEHITQAEFIVSQTELFGWVIKQTFEEEE